MNGNMATQNRGGNGRSTAFFLACERTGLWMKQPALWVKLAISLLLVLHLAAVFTAPFAAACNVRGSSSPLADAMYRTLRPYIAALFLDHGYFFFAPDPGPNHLVEYKVEFADGRGPIEGRFPNLATERPRLLYHRHFMLSESLYNAFVPPQAPPEPSPPPLTATAEQRSAYQLQHAAHERGHCRLAAPAAAV